MAEVAAIVPAEATATSTTVDQAWADVATGLPRRWRRGRNSFSIIICADLWCYHHAWQIISCAIYCKIAKIDIDAARRSRYAQHTFQSHEIISDHSKTHTHDPVVASSRYAGNSRRLVRMRT